jgi:DNA ligase (NAD+)
MSDEELLMYWDSLSVEALEKELKKHNELYWKQNQPEITDTAYDQLVELLRQKNPNVTLVDELVSDFGEVGTQIKHLKPMLSLDKCYQEKELLKWASKIQGNFICTPKIDGVACSLRYDQKGVLTLATTRGDGSYGEEITSNILMLNLPKKLNLSKLSPKLLKQKQKQQQDEQDLPLFADWSFDYLDYLEAEIEIRGEVYLPLDAFDGQKDRFSNPRNAAAGTLKQKDSALVPKVGLQFFAYDLLGIPFLTHEDKFHFLEEQGFTVTPFQVLERAQLEAAYLSMAKQRSELNYELDGVVYRANDNDVFEQLGMTSHHPRGAIAYKFQGDTASTIVKGIEWSVSRTGVLTPVCLVEPVKLSGAMVGRISMHHAGMIKTKNLSIGAEVLAMRRGGVIPHLEAVIKEGYEAISIPTTCPNCPKQCAKTMLEGDFLYCKSDEICDSRLKQSISYFAQMIGIEGFGGVWIEKLIEGGLLRSPVDFYRLKREDLLKLDLVGDGRADAWLSSVLKATTIPLNTFLQALGISDLGKTASQTLVQKYKTLGRIRALTVEEIAAIENFGVLTASHIVEGLKAYQHLIDSLLKYIKIADETEVEGIFKGQSFLFTGTLAKMKRNDAEALVLAHGGTIAGSVSKALSFLVVGAEGKAGSKLDKAKSIPSIQIISEEAFFEKIPSDQPSQD